MDVVLPAPFGPEKPEDLTGAHRQREVGDSQRRPELLAEPPGVDDEVAHFSDSAILTLSAGRQAGPSMPNTIPSAAQITRLVERGAPAIRDLASALDRPRRDDH